MRLFLDFVCTLMFYTYHRPHVKRQNWLQKLRVLDSEAVEHRTENRNVKGLNLAMTHRNFCNQY